MMTYIRDLIYSATISSTSPGVKVACFTASFVWTEMLAACSWARILIAVRATVRETPHRSDAMPVRGATHLHSDREAGRVVPGVALRTHEHAQGHLGLNGRDLHRQAHWVQGPSEAYINQIVGSEEPPLVFPANYTGSHLMGVCVHKRKQIVHPRVSIACTKEGARARQCKVGFSRSGTDFPSDAHRLTAGAP